MCQWAGMTAAHLCPTSVIVYKICCLVNRIGFSSKKKLSLLEFLKKKFILIGQTHSKDGVANMACLLALGCGFEFWMTLFFIFMPTFYGQTGGTHWSMRAFFLSIFHLYLTGGTSWSWRCILCEPVCSSAASGPHVSLARHVCKLKYVRSLH